MGLAISEAIVRKVRMVWLKSWIYVSRVYIWYVVFLLLKWLYFEQKLLRNFCKVTSRCSITHLDFSFLCLFSKHNEKSRYMFLYGWSFRQKVKGKMKINTLKQLYFVVQVWLFCFIKLVRHCLKRTFRMLNFVGLGCFAVEFIPTYLKGL